jgi:hypothetical protein
MCLLPRATGTLHSDSEHVDTNLCRYRPYQIKSLSDTELNKLNLTDTELILY